MRALREMTGVELKLFLRDPLTVVFVIVLPVVMLYVLNGVFGNEPDPTVWQGLGAVEFYTSSYVALVAAATGILAIPVLHVAGYREMGVLRRFRASALSPVTFVGAQVAVAALAAAVGALLVAVLSWVAYDAPAPDSFLGVAARSCSTSSPSRCSACFWGWHCPRLVLRRVSGCCCSSYS